MEHAVPNVKGETGTSTDRRGRSSCRIEPGAIERGSEAASAPGGSAIPSDTADAEEECESSVQVVLNAVDDLGMDDAGGQSIDGALSSVTDDTLVVFPPGTYRVSRQQTLESGGSIGLLGDSELVVGSDGYSVENRSIDSPGRLTIFSTAQIVTATDFEDNDG